MSSARGSVQSARFGPFAVDFRAGELLKNGRRIRLQDQPLQVLALLLEHPGETVTREELHQELWPNDTFVDFDHGLNNAINRLRETLCDSVENPRYIETLPRRGYRFISQVEREAMSEVPTPQELIQNVPQQGLDLRITVAPVSRPWWQRKWAAYVAFALVLSASLELAMNTWKGRLLGSAHAMRIEGIAVLPLENMTGDQNQEYLVDGMTDALTTQLAQMRGIQVISRTSAARFKGTKRALPDVAKELHVDAVVEGSISRSNDVLHVNAQLIYAPGDRHLWAHSYDIKAANLPDLQVEIADAVAQEIGATSMPGAVAHLSMAHAVNPEAYDLYLRAEAYHSGETREGGTDEGIPLLERSVSIDPQFAAAYAALATSYRVRAFAVEPENTEKWLEKTAVAIQKSLSLDPNLAEAYVSRGYFLWSPANNWAYERAVADYRHALSLNPNLAEAHHQIANVYNHVGLLDKAKAEIEKAVELDPLNTGIRFRVGINLLYQGKYEDSLAAIRDSEKFNAPLWAFQTSFALQHLRRLGQAQERVARILAEKPGDRGGSLTAMQALLAADAGDAHKAEVKIQEALAKGKGFQHFHHVAYAVASAYALLNRPEKALRYLQIAADDGFPCYPLFEHDSNLDNLRKNAQFLAFMAEQKRQWEYFGAHL
jgi:TolB-like protein/DNA-binding winged helix-turn-helix (wHTH) protein/tetratricopeptide (TPR) repeat protein